MAVPTPSDALVQKLRRSVAEPTSTTYSDEDLRGYLEAHPLLDELGQERYQAAATSPPTFEDNPDWGAGQKLWDANAASADIWDEKSAALAGKFDFTTDGQTFARSQLIKQAAAMARYYRSRQSARTVKLWPWPAAEAVETIANLAESDD